MTTRKTLHKTFNKVKQLLDGNDYSSARTLLNDLKDSLSGRASIALYEKYRSMLPFTSDYETATYSLGKLSQYESRGLLSGISIVSCCMNRNDNLKKALISWLQLPVDEIIIVDWSSSTPVSETISEIADDRVKVIRVIGEKKWILTYAFNVGLQFASYTKIFKLDADIEVAADFLEINNFKHGEFIRGYWKFAIESNNEEQKYVNGSFGCFKEDLQKIGYYNEFIRTYGWDDSDLYSRLSLQAALKFNYLKENSILHMEQEHSERLTNQDACNNMFLGCINSTEFYNMQNKFLVSLHDEWDASKLQDYDICAKGKNKWQALRISKDISIPNHTYISAQRYATLKLTSWIDVRLYNLLQNNIEHTDYIFDLFQQGTQKNVDEIFTDLLFHIFRKNIYDKKPDFRLDKFLEKVPDSCEQAIIHGLAGHYKIKYSGRDLSLEPTTIRDHKDAAFNDITSSNFKVLATSLYDEKSKQRMSEYIKCIRSNLEVFDAVVIFYEEHDGALISKIEENILNISLLKKIIYILIKKRPTFEYLYDAIDDLFPNSLAFIANADIAFDSTVDLIKKEIIQDSFFVLSRHEACPRTGKDQGLLMNQLGLPNMFSADAWIYHTPRRHHFRADFLIGSFHCDSFMNYYIANSGYKLYNPCLEISIFHIHDPEFNSSEEKAHLLHNEIQARLEYEATLNNNIYPINGVQWCSIPCCTYSKNANKLVSWYNTILNIKVTTTGSNLFQAILAILLAREVLNRINCPTGIFIDIEHPIDNPRIFNLLTYMQNTLADENVILCVSNNSTLSQFKSKDHTKCDISNSDFIGGIKGERTNVSHSLWGRGDETALADIEDLISDPSILLTLSPTSSDIDTYKLLQLLVRPQIESLVSIFNKLNNNGFNEVVPWLTDLECLQMKMASKLGKASSTPNISFITSAFNGEEFFQGYLENIAIAAKEVEGEVIIIDACSPQSEKQIFDQFIIDNPDYSSYFKYIRLESDPGLYNCWKIAIESSKADYISNANLDDRRSPFQAKILIDLLKNNTHYSGAATAIRATTARNTSWFAFTENQYWFNEGYSKDIHFTSLYLSDENSQISSQNIMHCMPVWHKSLHIKYGYFDEENYGTSADWAFWLLCTKNGEIFSLVPLVLSQYYINEQSHNRVNDKDGIKEKRIINDYIGIQQDTFIQQ